MIKKEQFIFRRREIRKPAADASISLCILPGISQMNLSAVPQPWRAQCHFRAPDARPIQCHRKEDVRISQDIVIKVIACRSVEMAEVQAPSAYGNRNTKLVLLIALAAQGNKIDSLGQCKVEQRPSQSFQWRALIVTTIEPAQHPMNPRQVNRRT